MAVIHLSNFRPRRHTPVDPSTLSGRGSFVIFLKAVEGRLGRKVEDIDGDLLAEAYIAGLGPDLAATLISNH